MHAQNKIKQEYGLVNTQLIASALSAPAQNDSRPEGQIKIFLEISKISALQFTI